MNYLVSVRTVLLLTPTIKFYDIHQKYINESGRISLSNNDSYIRLS